GDGGGGQQGDQHVLAAPAHVGPVRAHRIADGPRAARHRRRARWAVAVRGAAGVPVGGGAVVLLVVVVPGRRVAADAGPADRPRGHGHEVAMHAPTLGARARQRGELLAEAADRSGGTIIGPGPKEWWYEYR